MVATISRDELKGKMDRGENFVLVETLSPFMYEAQHLPGAVNLPPNKVQELAATLLPDKRAEIVVYCGGST
jgi:rhodanese-related sulfurtransferase